MSMQSVVTVPRLSIDTIMVGSVRYMVLVRDRLERDGED